MTQRVMERNARIVHYHIEFSYHDCYGNHHLHFYGRRGIAWIKGAMILKKEEEKKNKSILP